MTLLKIVLFKCIIIIHKVNQIYLKIFGQIGFSSCLKLGKLNQPLFRKKSDSLNQITPQFLMRMFGCEVNY
jgi:hypothetical protein